jgi:hypothetical protein
VSRRRRWLRRVLPLFTLLALGVWFAPAVVAKTGLRNTIARKALADVRGSVEVGGASLGWLSPVELRDVTIKDQSGRAVVTVPKITSQKSLLDLARNRAEPGECVLENPTVAVVCEKNTTNLEAAFAEYLKDDTPPAPTRTPVTVRVTGGTLTLTDAETSKTTSVEGITATVTIPASRAESVTAQLTAATGAISADASFGEASSVKLSSAGLALETFAPLLKRADPALTLAGSLTSDLRIAWGKDTLAVAGRTGVKQLVLAAPALNGDTLRLNSAELPLDVELAGRVVRVRKFDLTCDAGTLSAAGSFDPDEPVEKLLARPGLVLGANVELAKLAAKLPKLLRLKDGLELREGKVELSLASRADGAGTVWDGKLHASAIKATRAGKAVNWDEPLHVEFAGRYASGQLPTFDKLVCTSDFVAVNARTTPETVQAAANVYLHRLGQRLAEFIDLGGVALDGEASAQLVGRREKDGTFAASGVVELKNFAFALAEGKGLREPALKLELAATGKAPTNAPIELKTASVLLSAGGDELRVALLEPVSDLEKLASGAVELRLGGDVARWRSRVGAFVKIPPYQMSGTISAGGKAKLGAERVTVERLTVNLKNVKFRGAGLNIDEPSMSAIGDLDFTRATSTASFTRLTINSAPLSVTNGTLTFEVPKERTVVSGSGDCVTDLNRLGLTLKLYTDPRGPDALHGRGVGPIRFRYVDGVTTFGGALDVTNFVYGLKDDATWAEPTLRLEADGNYTDSTDAVALSLAKVDRPGLALDAKGSVGKVTTTQDVNFTGTLKYDWAKLTPLVREFLGGNFTATGSGTRVVAVQGQLAPPGAARAAPPQAPKSAPVTLKAPGVPAPKTPAPAGPNIFAAVSGEAALGWQSVKAYGFDVGPGELSGKMTRGVLTVAPISATFGGGKVTLAPTVKLDTTPGVLTLAKGPAVEKAKLTPQATAGALGYALPAIANAGQAEGEISARIDDNLIPLGDFTQANIKGVLVIHKATVGATPLVAQVAKLVGVGNTTMTLANEEAVPVQVANGRVHHQDFAFKISGTTFRTSGSVGFDNTLDLVVDVPLPKDLPLLKNNPLLQKAVAGKVVKVPVKGTLSRPALDPKAFEQAVVALAREGAKDVGKDLLEKELNKLFPNMPAPKSGGLPFPLPFGKKP